MGNLNAGAVSFEDIMRRNTQKNIDEIARQQREIEKCLGTHYNTGMEGGQSLNRVSMNFDCGPGATIEQLIVAEAYFGIVVDKIKANGHEVPKDIDNGLRTVSRELAEKLRNSRLQEIRALRIQADSMASAESKLAKINARLAELEELVK